LVKQCKFNEQSTTHFMASHWSRGFLALRKVSRTVSSMRASKLSSRFFASASCAVRLHSLAWPPNTPQPSMHSQMPSSPPPAPSGGLAALLLALASSSPTPAPGGGLALSPLSLASSSPTLAPGGGLAVLPLSLAPSSPASASGGGVEGALLGAEPCWEPSSPTPASGGPSAVSAGRAASAALSRCAAARA